MKRSIMEVLKSIFYIKDDEFLQEEIKKETAGFVHNNLIEKYSGYMFKFKIMDQDKKLWKHCQHFVKKFPSEIEYAKTAYGISKNEISFLCLFERFLLWEWNLIVDPDNENKPMTQSMIAEKFDIDRKTACRALRSLVDKHMLCEIPIGRDIYYIMNPHIMFIGKYVHKDLPKLFASSGYLSQIEYQKNKNKEENGRQ